MCLYYFDALKAKVRGGNMYEYSKKTLIEAEAASPEAYVKENGRYPILETTTTDKGDVVIVTGDNQGTFVRYTFTE